MQMFESAFEEERECAAEEQGPTEEEQDQHEDFYISLGERLRALREQSALTIEQAAARAEMTEEFLVGVESGSEKLSTLELTTLCKTYHIPLGDLLHDSDCSRELLLERKKAHDRCLGDPTALEEALTKLELRREISVLEIILGNEHKDSGLRLADTLDQSLLDLQIELSKKAVEAFQSVEISRSRAMELARKAEDPKLASTIRNMPQGEPSGEEP